MAGKTPSASQSRGKAPVATKPTQGAQAGKQVAQKPVVGGRQKKGSEKRVGPASEEIQAEGQGGDETLAHRTSAPPQKEAPAAGQPRGQRAAGGVAVQKEVEENQAEDRSRSQSGSEEEGESEEGDAASASDRDSSALAQDVKRLQRQMEENSKVMEQNNKVLTQVLEAVQVLQSKSPGPGAAKRRHSGSRPSGGNKQARLEEGEDDADEPSGAGKAKKGTSRSGDHAATSATSAACEIMNEKTTGRELVSKPPAYAISAAVPQCDANFEFLMLNRAHMYHTHTHRRARPHFCKCLANA